MNSKRQRVYFSAVYKCAASRNHKRSQLQLSLQDKTVKDTGAAFFLEKFEGKKQEKMEFFGR